MTSEGLDIVQDAPTVTKVRFNVSGESFDISLDELALWPETTLASRAELARKTGQVDKRDGVPLVEFNEDPQMFRILRHYMKTRELIKPADTVTRQLLLAAAGFYCFDPVVKMLMANESTVAGDMKADVKVAEGAPRDIGNGNFAPSAAVLKRLGITDTGASAQSDVAAMIAPFWRGGSGCDTLLGPDSDARADEHRARVEFAEDKDATPLVRKSAVVVLDEKTELKVAPAASEYPRMIYPITEVDPASVKLVANLGEFEHQFAALTTGFLDKVIGKLPVVIAGGSVLAALHRLPRVIPEDIKDFGTNVGRTIASAPDGLAERWGVALPARAADVKSTVVPAFSGKEPLNTMMYFRHMFAVDETFRGKWLASTQHVVSAGSKMSWADHAAEIWRQKLTLESKSLIKAEFDMWKETRTDEDSITNRRRYFEHMIVADEKFASKWADVTAFPKPADIGPKRYAKRMWVEKLTGDMKDAIGAEFKTWKKPDEKVAAIAATKSIAGFSAGTIREMLRANGRFARVAPLRTKATAVEFNKKELDMIGQQLFLNGCHLEGGKMWDTSPQDMFSGKLRIVDGNYSYTGREHSSYNKTPQLPPSDVAYVRMFESFRRTDLDLFLVTRSPDEALETLVKIYEAICEAAPGGTVVDIIRSAHAVTFKLPDRNIQVILRLYYSLEHVLSGFDVDCCCVGYDGKRVVALPRAVRALEGRVNIVDPSRQSLNFEARLVKYAKRGFAVAVPGVDINRQAREVRRKIDLWRASGQYLGLLGVQQLIGMLYALSGSKAARKLFNFKMSDYGPTATVRGRSVDALDDKVDPRTTMRRSDTDKPTFVYGTNLNAVLFTNVSSYDGGRGAKFDKAADVTPMVTFQVRAPHRQDGVDLLYSGAFHPTAHDWYHGK